MTSTVVREGEGHQWPGKLKEIIFSCDARGCDAKSTDYDLIAGGGMLRMGWTKHFNIDHYDHYCPNHSKPEE